MTVSELKNTLLRKGWMFRFISPNPLKKNDFGWKTISQVEAEHGGFEAYLKKISDSQGLKELNIDTRTKNGSSYINKGVFLVQAEPVEKVDFSIKNVEKSTTNVEKSTTNVDAENKNIENKEVRNSITSTNNTMNSQEDLKTHIENASMKTELRFLQAENDRLKESNKKLDQKNEELFNEVSKLTRELATDKTKNDLEFQKRELELLSKQKGGLSGIVDEVKNMDPKTLGMIISVFQPNNQAVKALMSSEEGSGGESLNGPKHKDEETQDFIQNSIIPMLAEANSGAVGMIGGLIEYFLKYPEHLVATYKKWLPGADIGDVSGKGEEEEEK